MDRNAGVSYSGICSIPIHRSFIQKVNLDECDAGWNENGRSSKPRRVKGEIEHRNNTFNNGLTGIVRTKGQRKRFGIWFQYEMNLSQNGSLVVINADGSTTQYNVDDSGIMQRDLIIEVFQCDGCPGFCGPFGVTHTGSIGGTGTCSTQPPIQYPCS